MKISLTLWRQLVLLHLTMVVVGVVSFGYIAREIVSGTAQTQHTRYLLFRQKDAKIRANETVEMLSRGLRTDLDVLRRGVEAAVAGERCAAAFASSDDPDAARVLTERMVRVMNTMHLDILTLVDPAGRVALRASDPHRKHDTAYQWPGTPLPKPTADVNQLLARARAGQTVASIEALPASILATERYGRGQWARDPDAPLPAEPGEFRTLADLARIELDAPAASALTDVYETWEERGLALTVVTPVRDDAGQIVGAAIACQLLNRTPGPLSRHLGVRGDIGALYLGRARVAMAADAAGVAKPIGSTLSEPVTQALLAGSVTQAGVEALASLGDLSAYRVLLDSQKRPIGVIYARTPTSQFGVVLESERVSERLAQANSNKIIWMTAATVGLLGFAIIIVNAEFLSKPLRDLVVFAQAIAAGDLDVRAPERGSTEVNVLARSLNQMAIELEKSYRELEDKVLERTHRLEVSEARYRDLIESAPDMIHTLDETGRITSVNAREAEVLGYTQAELEQMHLHELIAPDAWEATQAAVARAFASPSPLRYETVLVAKDGREICAEVTTTVRREGGQSIQTNIIRDVTEQRALQRQLIESERLSAVGEMIFGVAHEIRNPVNTLGITVRNLRDDIARSHPETELQREYDESLDILVSELERLDGLIEDFMTVARVPQLVLEDCDLAALIQDLVKMVASHAEQAGIETAAELPAGLEHIQGDGELLRRALLNLILNAMEAIEPGAPGRVGIRVAQDESETVVSVADNGCGIADEHRDRVFDIFFTTKDSGSGIGLSMVHRIVRAHGGRVTFETTVGQGATFRVVLPRAAAPLGLAKPEEG